MATLREFVTKWGFDVDESELAKIDQGVSRVQKNIQATAKVAVDMGKKLSLGVTLPFVGISAAAVKAAVDRLYARLVKDRMVKKFFQDVDLDRLAVLAGVAFRSQLETFQ